MSDSTDPVCLRGVNASFTVSEGRELLAELAKETELSLPILEAASAVRHEKSIDALKDINAIVHALPILKPNKQSILARSAGEILRDGIEGGCHDYAIAFAGVARACGFPVAFVDSADLAFLRGETDKKFEGHAFLKVYVEGHPDGSGRWILVDPTEGVSYDEAEAPGGCLPDRKEFEQEDGQGNKIRPCGRVEMYEAVNLWDVGRSIDPVCECMSIFKKEFSEKEEFNSVIFRPNPL